MCLKEIVSSCHMHMQHCAYKLEYGQEFIIYIVRESIQHCITLSKDTELKVMQYLAEGFAAIKAC